MQIHNILSELRAERARIDQAIRAIEFLNSPGSRVSPTTSKGSAATPVRKRRRMSATARKRLSELMKKRWASGKMGKGKKVA